MRPAPRPGLAHWEKFPRPLPLEPFAPRPELSSSRIWALSIPLLGRDGFLELRERFWNRGQGE